MQNRCKGVLQWRKLWRRGSVFALKRKIAAIALILLAALLLPGCGSSPARAPAATVDPYAGMVEVERGFGTKMWVRVHETLEVSPFLGWTRLDAVPEGYAVHIGVDVSEHQGTIDWAAAAADGVEFAIIRAGYRGYGARGTLVTDATFAQNAADAAAAGVAMGVYFFSQAVTPEEAAEEAEYLLALLRECGCGPERLALPVFFDWEDIGHDEARTDGVDGETVTECAEVFCRRVEDAGYRAGVYAYRYLAYFDYDLTRLDGRALWIGALGGASDFYYAHAFWQNAVQDGVKGINGQVDRDFWFEKLETDESSAA